MLNFPSITLRIAMKRLIHIPHPIHGITDVQFVLTENKLKYKYCNELEINTYRSGSKSELYCNNIARAQATRPYPYSGLPQTHPSQIYSVSRQGGTNY